METKILGLINNLAEVAAIRPKLLTAYTLTVVRDLLKSREIDVSYFAAGIVANLLAKCSEFGDNHCSWTIAEFSAKDLLNDLVCAARTLGIFCDTSSILIRDSDLLQWLNASFLFIAFNFYS